MIFCYDYSSNTINNETSRYHKTMFITMLVVVHLKCFKCWVCDDFHLLIIIMLIFDVCQEQCPPSIDDFLYICDDAYKRQEFLVMERNILQGLNFDINIPVPYRFLRRYAKVGVFWSFNYELLCNLHEFLLSYYTDYNSHSWELFWQCVHSYVELVIDSFSANSCPETNLIATRNVKKVHVFYKHTLVCTFVK